MASLGRMDHTVSVFACPVCGEDVHATADVDLTLAGMVSSLSAHVPASMSVSARIAGLRFSHDCTRKVSR